MIERLPRGEELLTDLKTQNMQLLPHCPPDMRSQLSQEFSSFNSRLCNLQASLKTWLDHLNRLSHMNQGCQNKFNQIVQGISGIRERMLEEKLPTTFSDLKQYVKTIEVDYIIFVVLESHSIYLVKILNYLYNVSVETP